MEKSIMLLTMLISFLVINISYTIFPYISRKTLSFGVSIPKTVYDHPKIILIRKKYSKWIIFFAIFFVAAIIIIALISQINAEQAAIISTILIFVNLMVNSVLYLRAHNQMKTLKSENQWQQDSSQLITIETGFRKKKIKTNPLWFVIHLLIITSTISISFLNYETIPDKIPIKLNVAGKIIRFAEKSYHVLLYIPLVQVFMTLIFLFVYYSISKAKQQIDPGNRQQTLQQTIIFRYRWSLYIIISSILMLIMLSLGQFSMIGLISSNLINTTTIVLPLILSIAAVFLSIATGQSGSRVKIKNSQEKASIVKDDDAYWKFGVFYYNPEDPAIFIEKRFGIGWTINWGRRSSWLIILGFLVMIGGFTILSFMLTR